MRENILILLEPPWESNPGTFRLLGYCSTTLGLPRRHAQRMYVHRAFVARISHALNNVRDWYPLA